MTTRIENGSRWREINTGKIATVIDADYSLGPRYRFDGEDLSTWWYCDIADFIIWGRFKRIDLGGEGHQ